MSAREAVDIGDLMASSVRRQGSVLATLLEQHAEMLTMLRTIAGAVARMDARAEDIDKRIAAIEVEMGLRPRPER